MIAMLDPKMLTVVVTGATSGIGESTCRRFAEAGSRVIAVARRGTRLESLKEAIGERCHIAVADLRKPTDMIGVIELLPAEFSRVNVVIANAGIALGLQPAHEAQLSEWESMVETNINGMLRTVHAVLPGMVARDEGHVVLISSLVADHPTPGSHVYGATKAFVRQFALNLRSDLIGKNIRVTSIEPGATQTEFGVVRFGGDAEKAKARYQGCELLGAEDVAEAIFWSSVLPRHVNVNRLQVTPVTQAFGSLQFARK